MKFLYLKGVEILGPFEVEEIIKGNDFSGDLLVCPEDKAEQGAAWKPASAYPEFQASLEKEIFTIKEAKPIVNTQDKDELSAIPNVKQEDKQISQTLPPLEDTSSTVTGTVNDEISFSEVMSQLSDLDKETDLEEDEDVKDHTFNIAYKEDNLLEDLPAHRLIGADKDSLNVPNYEVGEDLSKRKVDKIDIPQKPYDIKEISSVKNRDKDLVDISNNKILSSSDGRVKRRKSSDLLFIISFLVLMVVAVALCMAFWNVMSENTNNTQDNNTQATTNDNYDNIVKEDNDLIPEVQEEQSLPSTIAAEGETIKPASASYEEQVINIVKNTKLSSKGKTIGEYLQNTYGAEYSSSWSAKPFTDNVYIVEFFASKVRSEPYVYLFRVDVDQKKITGALNNITLDLLA